MRRFWPLRPLFDIELALPYLLTYEIQWHQYPDFDFSLPEPHELEEQ